MDDKISLFLQLVEGVGDFVSYEVMGVGEVDWFLAADVNVVKVFRVGVIIGFICLYIELVYFERVYRPLVLF